MAEHEARRNAIVEYLRDAPDHEAEQSDIVKVLDLRINGSDRKALFQSLADDGCIEKAKGEGSPFKRLLMTRSRSRRSR